MPLCGFGVSLSCASAWTTGIRDHAVGRALGLLHGQIVRRRTTDDLAGETGLSRSAFAGRFARSVGEPPMRYLAQACVLLKDGTPASPMRSVMNRKPLSAGPFGANMAPRPRSGAGDGFRVDARAPKR